MEWRIDPKIWFSWRMNCFHWQLLTFVLPRTGVISEIQVHSRLKPTSTMAFKKHWENTRIICWNVCLWSWDMFLHTVLTELHIFFATTSTFFSSTVFLISRLVFSLIRRQICNWKMISGLMKFICKKAINALLQVICLNFLFSHVNFRCLFMF